MPRLGIVSKLRTRRVPHFAGAYAAGCWIVLEVLSQLVEMQILPPVLYQLGLVLVVTLAPGVLVVAWFHGEKGAQETPLREKWLLAGVATLALASATMFYRGAATVLPTDTGPAVNRVAVLYLEDLSPNQEFQYVADGLTEGIIRRLSQVRALDVISRNGVAPFRDTDVSPDSIARVLDTGSLIDGTVEHVGDRVRIEIRLLEGGSGATVQRTSLELPAEELLAAQDSAVQEVARLMREWIGEEVRLREQQEVASTARVRSQSRRDCAVGASSVRMPHTSHAGSRSPTVTPTTRHNISLSGTHTSLDYRLMTSLRARGYRGHTGSQPKPSLLLSV